MQELIVLYDGTFLVIIKNIPHLATSKEILDAYAREYDFERDRLSSMWADSSICFKSLGIE